MIRFTSVLRMLYCHRGEDISNTGCIVAMYLRYDTCDTILNHNDDYILCFSSAVSLTLSFSLSLCLSLSLSTVTPFQCRLRDCTYSAPLYVNVRYTRQRQIVTKNGIQIGRIPIMLQSEHCILTGIIKIVKN